MRSIVWIVWALVAAFWTLGAWVLAELVQWSVQTMASAEAARAAGAVLQAPLPPWVGVWIDPVWLELVRSQVQWLLEAGQAILPAAGALVGWIVPLVWVGWGLGMLTLLALAIGAHWLIGRLSRSSLSGTTTI
ncbi:hypothetical protein [Caldimonas caldifontis]|uniref:Uncharacterized protein n=1 Tax=Caldimonas caldifontis TaxID=1452508 RepID=A0A2S5SWB3_9BURK|nr:hypothetical protein [Caldimonas caldifontis]PPE67053.1 hypothetical protein C1704_06265 [Caldimonas caldifontis]